MLFDPPSGRRVSLKSIESRRYDLKQKKNDMEQARVRDWIGFGLQALIDCRGCETKENRIAQWTLSWIIINEAMCVRSNNGPGFERGVSIHCPIISRINNRKYLLSSPCFSTNGSQHFHSFLGVAVVTLEQLTSTYPLSGTLITFSQFLLVSVYGLYSNISWSQGYPTLRPRHIPLIGYAVQVIIFYIVSLLNNAAFSFNVPMSVHIIFRSAGLVISMLFGWAISGKRYTTGQIFSVFLVTVGVMLTTISAVDQELPVTSPSMSKYIQGILVLTLALVLSGALGLIQDRIYSKYGREASTWQESMFYLHALALPLFFFMKKDISMQFSVISSGPRTTLLPLPKWIADLPGFRQGVFLHLQPDQASLLLHLPKPYITLLLNTLTQLICVAGVHRLTTRLSALTVTLVLAVRKATSLLISVLVLAESPTVNHRPMWSGGALVLFGTVIYSIFTSRNQSNVRKLKTN
ncbi:UDP-xylose and UDP-N-acetylglucosamine transporter [Mycena indigotica]|uniref:UDP-xylose and UDP-N-acetylglucosamine transporter n=1 Tax=Mycena indigotica TaxID=2126181 RepID=A0A8H6S2M7_9AGAR|nr:UDP-xylose and UDP-N-acetylglucosamine transporter [Mycena indigotica]KAF7291105.1 UDP-xylose and UDP-N-acetylglucosamine transporter [Mycena indigotica]